MNSTGCCQTCELFMKQSLGTLKQTLFLNIQMRSCIRKWLTQHSPILTWRKCLRNKIEICQSNSFTWVTHLKHNYCERWKMKPKPAVREAFGPGRRHWGPFWTGNTWWHQSHFCRLQGPWSFHDNISGVALGSLPINSWSYISTYVWFAFLVLFMKEWKITEHPLLRNPKRRYSFL